MPDFPSSSSASGIWTLDKQVKAKMGSNFPVMAPSSVEYLVIAGGGGGDSGAGGGGGAGGYRTNTFGETSGRGSSAEAAFSVSAGISYTVTVGSGGVGGGSYPAGGYSASGAGTNSVFSTITSLGGGSPGGQNATATSGGSGGGGGGGTNLPSQQLAGAGTANQGYDGAAGIHQNRGGGGGGAGSAGNVLTGGNGVASSITGSSVTRAGGGGAGGYSSFGSGGSGGGGTGTSGISVAGGLGTVNTGSGGGGGGGEGSPQFRTAGGGAGGSGVVILRYPDTFPLAASTTGSPTVTNPTGYRVYTFTASGSITF